MAHEVCIIPRILEMLEIEVSIIPRTLKILESCLSIGSTIRKCWKLKSPLFPGSWRYGRRAGGGGRAAPGVVLCCLGLFLEHVSWNFWISWKYWKSVFFYILGFLQKRRAPKFHAEWSGFRGEISHMRPIQGRKQKLFKVLIYGNLKIQHRHIAITDYIE